MYGQSAVLRRQTLDGLFKVLKSLFDLATKKSKLYRSHQARESRSISWLPDLLTFI